MIDIIFISIILLFHINQPVSTFYRKNNPACAILSSSKLFIKFSMHMRWKCVATYT